MKMKFNYILILVLLATANKSFAQEVVGSGGGKLKNSDVKVTVTIGEPAAGELKNGNTIVDVGFQQVYESEVISIEETLSKLTLTVFPNPTANKVFVSNEKATNLSYTVCDVTGKVISTNTSKESKIELNLTGNAVGTYFIRFVNPATMQQKTFKIIKK